MTTTLHTMNMMNRVIITVVIKVISINEFYYILNIWYLADFLVDLVTCFLLMLLLSDLRTNDLGCCCCLLLFVIKSNDLVGLLVVSFGVSWAKIKSPIAGPIIAVIVSNSVGDAVFLNYGRWSTNHC